MRPIKLTMQAFGPYAGKEVIDFTLLENRTMFVISGKTGSGKTTIFDGISFAIYGKASGEDRVGIELRSQFAQDNLLTEVSLVFSLKGETYYIIRSPQQEKKKQRGEGYTTLNAKAELYKMKEEGERILLASNVREADEKIREIIQLDANQFKQILMIPQGEFRKLLISDSKEKEAILQRLFHTEIYKQIEVKLKEDANFLKSQVETGILDRKRILKNIEFHGNELLESALMEEPLNDQYILSLLSDHIQSLQQTTKNLAEKLKLQREKRDEAKKNLDVAEDLLKQLTILDELKVKKKELTEKEEEINQRKKEISLAKKAERLKQQDDLCRRLKKELDRFEIQLQTELNELENSKMELKQAREKLLHEEEKTEQRLELNSQLIHLKSMKEEVYSYATHQVSLHKIEDQLKTLQHQISIEKKKVSDYQATFTEKEQELKSLSRLQIDTYELEKKITKMETVFQQLNSLDKFYEKSKSLEKNINQQRLEVDISTELVENARSTLHKMEDKWIKSQAGQLAHTLKDGMPCPVCGSLEHPEKAMYEENHPSENDLKKAKENLDFALRQLSTNEQKWIKSKTEAEILHNNIVEISSEIANRFPDFKVDNIKKYINRLHSDIQLMKEQFNEYSEKVNKYPDVERQISTLKGQINQLNIHVESLIEEEKVQSIAQSEFFTTIQNLKKRIPPELRDKNSYNVKIASLQQKTEEMERALQVAKEKFTNINEKIAKINGVIQSLNTNIESQNETLQVERNVFIKMLEEEKFTSYHHFHHSLKSSSELNHLDETVREYYEQLRSISDRLHDYEERLKNVAQPNMERLEKLFLESEQIYTSLTEQHNRIFMQIIKNKEIMENVLEINKKMKDLETEYELVGHLSDITRGQNTYRLSFERFVLASFLDDILNAANGRLVKMTGGRYQLLRKTDRSKGNIQSGLELLVFNQYTGQERHVKTLSGGESFKASLSLALGLSDIVQEYAGGVSLETMFIDEGFGTLDPESLDNAIEALMDIQSSGRLVGIISHVPELKERIDARLEVKAEQSGSTTEFVFLG